MRKFLGSSLDSHMLIFWTLAEQALNVASRDDLSEVIQVFLEDGRLDRAVDSNHALVPSIINGIIGLFEDKRVRSTIWK